MQCQNVFNYFKCLQLELRWSRDIVAHVHELLFKFFPMHKIIVFKDWQLAINSSGSMSDTEISHKNNSDFFT